MNMMFRALQADYILVLLFYCILEERRLSAYFPLEYCRLERYISTWSRISFAVEQQLLRQRFVCAPDDMCYVPSLLKIDKFLDFPGFAQPKNMFVRRSTDRLFFDSLHIPFSVATMYTLIKFVQFVLRLKSTFGKHRRAYFEQVSREEKHEQII